MSNFINNLKKNNKDWDWLWGQIEKLEEENLILKDSLNVLKNFCAQQKYDLSPLVRNITKPIEQMTEEELLVHDYKCYLRQRGLRSETPSNIVPMPTPEENEKLIESMPIPEAVKRIMALEATLENKNE
jgi:hypothetical protein